MTHLWEAYQNVISQISISDKHKYQPLGTDTKIKDVDPLLGEALKEIQSAIYKHDKQQRERKSSWHTTHFHC